MIFVMSLAMGLFTIVFHASSTLISRALSALSSDWGFPRAWAVQPPTLIGFRWKSWWKCLLLRKQGSDIWSWIRLLSVWILLPKEIFNVIPLRLITSITANPRPYYSSCICIFCRKTCWGFVYHCSACKFDFKVKCALLPWCIIEPENHKHRFIHLMKLLSLPVRETNAVITPVMVMVMVMRPYTPALIATLPWTSATLHYNVPQCISTTNTLSISLTEIPRIGYTTTLVKRTSTRSTGSTTAKHATFRLTWNVLQGNIRTSGWERHTRLNTVDKNRHLILKLIDKKLDL